MTQLKKFEGLLSQGSIHSSRMDCQYTPACPPSRISRVRLGILGRRTEFADELTIEKQFAHNALPWGTKTIKATESSFVGKTCHVTVYACD